MTFLSPTAHWSAIAQILGLLRRQRELTWEMTKREFTDRYAGAAIGFGWAFAHPLITLVVYVFVFVFVFKVKLAATAVNLPADFTVYLLSGLVPWLAFQEALSKGTGAVTGNSNLVKQVIFPIEVLPAKGVLAACMTQCIFLACLIGYMLIRFHELPWTAALLPFLVLSQALGMLGVSLGLAVLGAYLRDLKEFVQVFCLINIYLMPVVYLPEWVPEMLRPLVYLNPFSYLTWCYQDALYFGEFAHPWAWGVSIAFNLFCLSVGYRLFRKLKHQLGNVL